MLTLYDHPLSPYAQKVKIALREKGEAFGAPLPGGLGAGGARVHAGAGPPAEVSGPSPDPAPRPGFGKVAGHVLPGAGASADHPDASAGHQPLLRDQDDHREDACREPGPEGQDGHARGGGADQAPVGRRRRG